MIRTTFNALILVGAIAFASAANDQPPKIPVPTIPRPEVDPKMPYFLVCAKTADDCARTCETCAAHCARLIAEGKKEHLQTLRLCQDCAALCEAAARITARDGPTTDLITLACAEACKRCGEACEKHSADPMMKRCAESCRTCEKVCRQMHEQSKAARPVKMP